MFKNVDELSLEKLKEEHKICREYRKTWINKKTLAEYKKLYYYHLAIQGRIGESFPKEKTDPRWISPAWNGTNYIEISTKEWMS